MVNLQANVFRERGRVMRNRAKYLILASAGLFGLVLFLDAACPPGRRFFARPLLVQTVAQPVGQKQPAKGAADSAAKEAIMANVRTFTEAFNKRDVKTLLKLFAEDCVLTEADGSTIVGLKELEEEFKESFEADPDAKLSVSVESLQVVAPDVVIEEGKTTFFPDGKTLTAETDYQATHVKRDGKWLMSRVRSFNRVVLSPYDQLRELEFLVGDWVDEGEDSIVESSYHWDANKTFLLNNFSVKVKGQKVLVGTQRIGRDPLTKQLKAWVFDSEGGYAESLWSNVDDSWIMRAKGVRSDGKVVTVTNRLTQLSKDRYRFDSADRIVGDERMPDISVVVVRRPPNAKR
jgi:uncharacterized protein (TIGR02246 family)